MEQHREPSRTLETIGAAIGNRLKTVEEEDSTPEASKRLGGRRIELSSTRATLLMKPFLWRTNLKKKTVVVLRSSHVRIL